MQLVELGYALRSTCNSNYDLTFISSNISCVSITKWQHTGTAHTHDHYNDHALF